MSKLGSFGARLYSGEISYDFVGKRRTWYTVSALILLIASIGLFGRGLNLGIEFRGGAEFQLAAPANSVDVARDLIEDLEIENPIITELGSGDLRIQTSSLDDAKSTEVVSALGEKFGVATGDVRVQLVGPTWGADITAKAVQALWVFLLLVSIVLALYFEWRMAVAAIVALIHDVVITVGIYALTGFEVTPATVIGVLTILGYSLYDTVVVFDKVKENTKHALTQSKMSYSQLANLALNQTLVRSINTSIVALLPVAAILVVGAGILGAGTLRDLSLALFVGMLAGTYSSITVATPVLAQLKDKQPEIIALAKRAASKSDSTLVTNVPSSGRTQPRRRTPRSKR